MANAPRRMCPRCRAIVQGRCETCYPARGRAYDATRGHAAARGYGYRWQQFRRQYLAYHPLCVDCEGQGRIAPATEVHHVEKLKDAPERQYDDDNLMALCKECHSVRTARGE